MCNLLARIRNTPTVELLATAGAGILGDRAQWEARLQRDHDDRRDRADAKRTQGRFDEPGLGRGGFGGHDGREGANHRLDRIGDDCL